MSKSILLLVPFLIFSARCNTYISRLF